MKLKWQIALVILLALILGGSFYWLRFRPSSSSLIAPVVAQEIYPLFDCPCCDQTIDQCTCSMAAERRAFLDGLANAGASEKKALLAYVKRYGLDSLVDEQRRKELRQQLVAQAPADRPIIAIKPEQRDLGQVSQQKGVVTTEFELENRGQSDLVIEKLETSCGCTSAAIVYQGQEGPKFNMPGHGINEKIKDWRLVLPPGAQAKLKVYYDPNTHQNFRGAAVRAIYIFSNDPIDSKKKVEIELTQVD